MSATIRRLLWLTSVCLGLVCAADVNVSLRIERGAIAPDCRPLQDALTVNRAWSGPTVWAREGDFVNMEIANLNYAPIAIHIHGLRQGATPASDGSAFIASAPLAPFETRTVRSSIGLNEAGTYWYHGHIALTDMSVFGALIVLPSATHTQPLPYDDERVLVLSDLYYENDLMMAEDLLATVPGHATTWPGEGQSLLTNGRTVGSGGAPSGDCQYAIVEVERDKVYRVRVINANAILTVDFRIQGHTFTVIEADAVLTRPYGPLDSLELSPGQRYSIVVHANAATAASLAASTAPQDFWMFTQARWIGRAARPTNGFAILRYVATGTQPGGAPLTSTVAPPPLPALPAETAGFGDALRSHATAPPAPPAAARTIMLRAQEFAVHAGVARAGKADTTGAVTFTEPSDGQTLLQHAGRGTLGALPMSAQPVVLQRNEVVDLVFQSHSTGDTQPGGCDLHAWHLHGHDFYVLSYGAGAYNASTAPLDATEPLLRDTVSVFPSVSTAIGAPCGWTKVRFVASNPGAWLVHCHTSFHMLMGMAAALVVDAPALQSGAVDLGCAVPDMSAYLPLPPPAASARLGSGAVVAIALAAVTVVALAAFACARWRRRLRVPSFHPLATASDAIDDVDEPPHVGLYLAPRIVVLATAE